MSEVLRADARIVLEILSSIPFQELYILTRSFEDVPSNPGFYAFRHRQGVVLYIGVGTNLRRRFRNGHRALSWAFVDRLDPDDVRIATVDMGKRTFQQVEYIETIMIQSARPIYNIRMK